MTNLETGNPTQRPSLHKDLLTFDDPVRKVCPGVAALLGNFTEWAGSETFYMAIEDDEVDEVFDDEEDDDDEEEIDDDESLGEEGGTERIH